MKTKSIFTSRAVMGSSLLSLLLLLGACATPKGGTVDERRAYTRDMRNETLVKAYDFRPALRDEIQNAAGYAVFSNIGAQIFLLGGGQGFGVVNDNRTGQETFMNMASGAVGIGLGVRDFRAIFVFDDPEIMEKFIETGWQFGGEADAAAIAGGDRGAAAHADASTGPASGQVGASATAGVGDGTDHGAVGSGKGMRIYQITENGIALQARIAGTRYWKSRELN